jgi:hypothetical protein
MTPQELFDKVATHLLAQDKPSVSTTDKDSCMYRSQDGLKCAVGCLIPDDLYRPTIEYIHIRTLLDKLPAIYSEADITTLAKAGISEEHIGLLSALQSIHDVFSPTSWCYRLHCLADDMMLNKGALRS